MKKIMKFLKSHKILVLVVVLIFFFCISMLLRPGDPTTGMAMVTAELRDITTYNSFVGNVQPASERSILANASERVVEMFVEEGDVVQKGDIIARLDTATLEYNIARQEISLASTQTSNSYNVQDAQRSYDNYKEALDAGLNSSLQSVQNQLDNAYYALLEAQTLYSETQTAIDNGTYSATRQAYTALNNTRAEYDKAQAAVDAAKAQVTEGRAALEEAQKNNTVSGSDALGTTELETAVRNAQETLNELEQVRNAAKQAKDDAEIQFFGQRSDILKNLQSSIDSAQRSYDKAVQNYDASDLQVQQQLETYRYNIQRSRNMTNTDSGQLELQNLKDSIADYEIVAPCSGTITSLKFAEGDMVSNGASVGVISDLDSMKITIRVDEYSILNTNVGYPVTIYIDSIGRTYEGEITWVASSATMESGVSFYEATVGFSADSYVRSGMSVEVRLTNVDEKNIVCVPANSLYYDFDNTAYVMMEEDGRIIGRTVTVGVSDGTYVQILDGLQAGDTILRGTVPGNLVIQKSGEAGSDATE